MSLFDGIRRRRWRRTGKFITEEQYNKLRSLELLQASTHSMYERHGPEKTICWDQIAPRMSAALLDQAARELGIEEEVVAVTADWEILVSG